MLLLVNVDDISGELVPHVIDGLMERGAYSVHVVPAVTKKGRLEYLFMVDAPVELAEPLAGYLAGEIGTIGVRVLDCRHIHYDYRMREMQVIADADGDRVQVGVAVKEILNGDGQVVYHKAEYEDLRAAAAFLGQAGVAVSLSALKKLVEQAAPIQEDAACPHIQVHDTASGEEDPASA